ncbi:TerD family protein [Streptomyces fagopyri]|uniref:hypothetical protein n=1 Tax=Streptomyces fagopyri TaxID=2662397 RepID=UPI0037F3A629
MNIFRRPPAPTATAPDPAPTGTGISLTKGESAGISLVKTDPTVQITAHLDWNGGSASRRARGADLELYVLHVPASGVSPGGKRSTPKEGGAIYYRNLGSLDQAPYIRHHGDSLTPGRESATIGRIDRQGYALICAYSAVGNGVGSFKSYGAKAIVTDGANQTITVPLYDNNQHAYWVAIALVDFTHDNPLISQVERYSRPNSEARPMLYTDGRFLMDAGPVEFK